MRRRGDALRWAVGVLALAAGPGAAAGLDGVYDLDCAAAVSDARVTISGNRIEFWETACSLENPVNVRDLGGAVLFDMRCTGEGETWTDRVLLMPSLEGGLVRVATGFAITYQRCQ